MKQIINSQGPVQGLRHLSEHAHFHISHHPSCMSYNEETKQSTIIKASCCITYCIRHLYIYTFTDIDGQSQRRGYRKMN